MKVNNIDPWIASHQNILYVFRESQNNLVFNSREQFWEDSVTQDLSKLWDRLS